MSEELPFRAPLTDEQKARIKMIDARLNEIGWPTPFKPDYERLNAEHDALEKEYYDITAPLGPDGNELYPVTVEYMRELIPTWGERPRVPMFPPGAFAPRRIQIDGQYLDRSREILKELYALYPQRDQEDILIRIFALEDELYKYCLKRRPEDPESARSIPILFGDSYLERIKAVKPSL